MHRFNVHLSHRGASAHPWPLLGVVALALLAALSACSQKPETPGAGEPTPESIGESYDQGLLLSLAVLGKTEDGKPMPLPAQLGFLRFEQGRWTYETLEDEDSNVFHKALVYRSETHGEGILTLGGSDAVIKLWRPGQAPMEVWREDFGGRFSRMRDGELGDLYGNGSTALAVATHDQGVVAAIHEKGDGWVVDEMDREPNTFVHEIEVGDLDGDGIAEVYATPSARNKLDGSPQAGVVTRYRPHLRSRQDGELGGELGGDRTVVADLDDRHAKEILVADVDGDGRDELYAVVEAVSGGEVEILRFDADTAPTDRHTVATLPDKLCRFLTVGDVEGDGTKELVASGSKSGLWLLTPGEPGEPWTKTNIDRESGGFEHASLLTDLDGDGRDELYVASDTHGEVRRYAWRDGTADREVIYKHEGGLKGFTWNLTPFPARMRMDHASAE